MSLYSWFEWPYFTNHLWYLVGFNQCWLKPPMAWKHYRHAPSWWFYWHCGIEETGSLGIICIVGNQVLRHPSEHGPSSMGKHLLAKAQIAKWHELAESWVAELTSSTVHEITLAILKSQGSRGVTIVSSQRQFMFYIQVNPYWPKWQTKCSKLAAQNLKTSNYHHHTWIVLAKCPGNTPAVRLLARDSGRFGSRYGQIPDPLCLGEFVTRTGYKSTGFWPDLTRTLVPFYRSYDFASTLAPIKYLSSDRIMTWWICRLCSFSPSFMSRFQICNPTNIRWIAVE